MVHPVKFLLWLVRSIFIIKDQLASFGLQWLAERRILGPPGKQESAPSFN
jgi:hypothetical protein